MQTVLWVAGFAGVVYVAVVALASVVNYQLWSRIGDEWGNLEK